MTEAPCKRKRQYAPKTKTGCRTCKRRHLKCGEERPECANCLLARLLCEGYGIWGGGTKATEHAHDRAKWTPQTERSTTTLPVTMRVLSRHHTPIPFQNISHAEQSCFDYFVHKTVLKIPGVFFSHFWADLVLRASSTELPILHAAVALGSAHRSADLNLYGSSVPSSFRCWAKMAQMDEHETFALKQYNKSIAQLRNCQFGEENVAEVRTALVACVLYVSLELLRGDYSTAVIHTRHGLNLLRRLKRDFEVQAFCPKGAPESVDDYLIEAFTRLNLQSIHVGAGDALFNVARGQSLFTNWKLSDVFADMFEARRTFDSLMYLILRLSEQIRNLEFGGLQPSADILRHHRFLQIALSTWLQTFIASQEKLQRITTHPLSFGIALLQAFHTMASIQVATMLSTSETCYDELTSAFTSILAQTVAIYRKASEMHHRPFSNDVRITGFSFTVDIGTLPLLSYVATKCRVPWLRRQAIALLLAAPHREGIWDGVVVAHNAQRVLTLEENGFFDHLGLDLDSQPFDSPEEKNKRYLLGVSTLPEASRFRHVKVIASRVSAGKGTLVCWRRNDDSSAGWEEEVEEFDLADLDRGDTHGFDFPC